VDSAEQLSPIAKRITALSGDVGRLEKFLDARSEEARGDFGPAWWRLVRDAYEGAGGFRDAVHAATRGDREGPGSYERGRGGSRNLSRIRASYLSQFTRENDEEFQRRVRSSTYLNLVAPVVDIYHGHLTRRAPKRSTDNAAVSAWWSRADAHGRSADEWLALGIQRAQLFGWCAAIFDRPEGDHARGTVATRATWLDPEEVIDWSHGEDGSLDWIRLRSEREERNPVTGVECERCDYTIWTRTEWVRVSIKEHGESDGGIATTPGRKVVEAVKSGVHNLGRVPVAVLRWRPRLDACAFYGISQVSDVVPLALALFNTESQLTHHLANAVFSILAVQTDRPEAMADLKLGTNNGISYPTGTNAPSFVAPPESVSMQLQVRADQIIDAIYQAAKVERPKSSATGGDVASGIARTYDFQQTEASLQSFVRALTAFEYECAGLVAMWDSAPVVPAVDPCDITDAVCASTSIEYPTRFDVRGLQDELGAQFAVLTDTVRAQLPPIAVKHARETIALGLNPQASSEDERTIRAEIDAMYRRDTAAMGITVACECDGECSANCPCDASCTCVDTCKGPCAGCDAAASATSGSPTVTTLADAHAAGHAEMAAAIDQLSPAADGALVAHPPMTASAPADNPATE
jgi:hypothetical protein